MRHERRIGIGTTILIALLIGLGPSTASAQANGCLLDFNGDALVTIGDFGPFLALWSAGNTQADLNGDNVVDLFDAWSFQSYFPFAPCIWRADFQYNRAIDPVDALFFNFLFASGSLRVDFDGNGVPDAGDALQFNALFGTRY